MVRTHKATRFSNARAPRAMQKKARSAKVQAARLKLSKPMRVLVDRRVDRKLETKVAYFHNYSWGNFSPKIIGTPGASSFQQILPEVPQAGQPGSEPADRENRVGSDIHVMGINIKGVINMMYTEDQTWSSLLARLIVCSAKGHSYWPEVSPVATLLAGEFLRAGATTMPYNADIQSQMTNINFNRVTTHHERRYNFNGDYAYGNFGGLGTKNVTFNINLKCRNKVLKYSDPTDVFPRNYAPFLCAGYTAANGSAVGGTPLYGQYVVTMRFKDA